MSNRDACHSPSLAIMDGPSIVQTLLRHFSKSVNMYKSRVWGRAGGHWEKEWGYDRRIDGCRSRSQGMYALFFFLPPWSIGPREHNQLWPNFPTFLFTFASSLHVFGRLCGRGFVGHMRGPSKATECFVSQVVIRRYAQLGCTQSRCISARSWFQVSVPI